MDPNPTKLSSLVKPEEVEKHRSLSCVAYDGCLDAATRHAWRSWSCGRCGLFAFGKEMRAAESARLARLRPQA